MKTIKLPVKYMNQNDSNTSQGYRMCQSSTIAMMVEYLRPHILGNKGKQEDDEYLGIVNLRGDTTVGALHELTLRALGFTSARFRTNLTEKDIHSQLEKGIPVGVGIWIRGHITSNLAVTGGGGHYILIVGRTENGDFIVHDPNGELDLVNGRYVSNDGAFKVYSRANFLKRWTNGGQYGWGHIVSEGPQPKEAPKTDNNASFSKANGFINGKPMKTYLIEDESFIRVKDLIADGKYKVDSWDGKTKTVKISGV